MPSSLLVAPALHLTAEGAAWLPDERTIVVADLHIGYARAARRRGGYLPGVETAGTLAARVLAIADRLGARRLVVAGDLRHSTRDADAEELAEVAEFLERLSTIERVDAVAGNHDRGAVGMSDRVRTGEFDIVHAPPHAVPERWTICGHLHPSAMVRDETGAGARYPCALVGPRIVVLPAFSSWAGGTTTGRLLASLPAGEWRRYAVGGGVVVEA